MLYQILAEELQVSDIEFHERAKLTQGLQRATNSELFAFLHVTQQYMLANAHHGSPSARAEFALRIRVMTTVLRERHVWPMVIEGGRHGNEV